MKRPFDQMPISQFWCEPAYYTMQVDAKPKKNLVKRGGEKYKLGTEKLAKETTAKKNESNIPKFIFHRIELISFVHKWVWRK